MESFKLYFVEPKKICFRRYITAFVYPDTGFAYIGIAQCGLKDAFSRKIGRLISERRAICRSKGYAELQIPQMFGPEAERRRKITRFLLERMKELGLFRDQWDNITVEWAREAERHTRLLTKQIYLGLRKANFLLSCVDGLNPHVRNHPAFFELEGLTRSLEKANAEFGA